MLSRLCFNFLILLISLSSVSCGILRKKMVARKFTIEKKWVRNTLAKEYLGYRHSHRMSPIVTPDRIIGGNAIDGLVVYDRFSGNEQWRLKLTHGIEAGAQKVGNTLYFGASDGYVYSIDLDRGQINWTFPVRAEVLGRPMVKDNVVYIVAGNNIAFALNAKTGKQIWMYNRRDPSSISIRGGSRPSVKGQFVYIGFSDGSLVALNKKKGNVIWEKSINKNRRFRDVDSHPVIDGSRIYVSSYDGSLYCLNRKNGHTIWRIDEGGFSSVTVAQNKLFYATSNGKIMAVDKKFGKTLWTYTLHKGVATRPVSYRGLVIFGEYSGALRVLDANNGKEVGFYHPGRGIMSTPQVDRQTGDIYFISVNANLYALKMSWKSSVEKWPWE